MQYGIVSKSRNLFAELPAMTSPEDFDDYVDDTVEETCIFGEELFNQEAELFGKTVNSNVEEIPNILSNPLPRPEKDRDYLDSKDEIPDILSNPLPKPDEGEESLDSHMDDGKNLISKLARQSSIESMKEVPGDIEKLHLSDDEKEKETESMDIAENVDDEQGDKKVNSENLNSEEPAGSTDRTGTEVPDQTLNKLGIVVDEEDIITATSTGFGRSVSGTQIGDSEKDIPKTAAENNAIDKDVDMKDDT